MCGKCKSGLVEVEDTKEVENRRCPWCDEKTLRVEENILWD
jgi:hypothetical protein